MKAAHASRRAQDPVLLAKSDEWRTPGQVFAYASERYGPFLLDAAAAQWNHQLPVYFSKQQDSLKRRWARRTWCNPPYSPGFKEQFLEHGRAQVLAGEIDLVCFLLPHDTSDGYWRRHVEGPAGRLLGCSKSFTELGTVVQTRWSRLTVEKTELYGRLRYEHHDGTSSCRPGTARHSSALVVFARPGLLAWAQTSARWVR